MNFAFLGTPGFAAWVLADLTRLGRRPAVVLSGQDRARGRGQKVSPPAVVVEARRLDLDSLQVADVNERLVSDRLRESAVTVLVVAAFGQLLTSPVLESFTCLNVHASLLPAYRGAAPVERALASGESCTGVSIMKMVERLDEGPVALQTSVSIGRRDDAGSLSRLLALAGALGVDQVLTGLADGTVRWTPQRGNASYAAKLGPDDSLLHPDKPAASVHDQVRSLSPAVGAPTSSGTVAFKVWRTWPYGDAGLEPVPSAVEHVSGHPGSLGVSDTRLFIGCGRGAIEVLAVQPAGKTRMAAADFIRGYGARLGDRLDPPQAAAPGQSTGVGADER